MKEKIRYSYDMKLWILHIFQFWETVYLIFFYVVWAPGPRWLNNVEAFRQLSIYLARKEYFPAFLELNSL